MERAAHRRVPLMTFGSGLPCGPARSPIVFPSPLQAQPHHQHHPSTQKRRGGGTHIRPSHRAGCLQASSINDLRARTRLGVGSLLRLSFLPSAGPAPGPDPACTHQHQPSTRRRRGGGTYARPSHRAGCSQPSSINDLRARTRLWVGSLLRLSFLTLCRSSTRP
ncbi:hypothetical protein DPEC_G00156690 [Dallia pectoralis]|uniref:Uncharacterized protein n=1 Tax=Dallia pectoralis TaxID=75939 RepID=A0ACC2GKM4_DALPE|nr:hypothetical protein DPEC_G00156690 [Dallia pectoralis]